MTPNPLDTARQLVACSLFRWLPGIRVLPDAANAGARCVRNDDVAVFAVEGPIEMAPSSGNDGEPIRQRGRVPLASGPVVEAWSDDAITGEEVPDLDDPATGGTLMAALGHEAARVRYSPSLHKQAAGTPWLADLFGSSCNSSITMHATLGRACAAVMIELSGRTA